MDNGILIGLVSDVKQRRIEHSVLHYHSGSLSW